MVDMDLSSIPSLNSLSVLSNISSGIHYFEDIFFWERLKFDWVSNLNSFNDFAFTFLDDDPDVLLMAHSDINILKQLLGHWKDLANRHDNIERLSAAEYKFIYFDSLKCSTNMWEFLQIEYMRTANTSVDVHQSSQSLHRQAKVMKRSHSDRSHICNHQSSCMFRQKSLNDVYIPEFDKCNNKEDITITSDAHIHRDTLTLEFIDFFASLNQNLALYLLIEGPRTIPPQFRNIYKNLIQILCKTHSSFLPTIMQMKKDDRLRPHEYEGSWESDAVCNVCYETHGAFVKRCCDTAVCESCFTQYVNHQVNSLSRIHIECPATHCRKPIRFQSIWIRLNENNRNIYEKIKNNQQQTDTKKLCPHCMQFYELSYDEKYRLTKKKLVKYHKHGFNVKCRMCQWEWCFKCQTPVHTLTCKKNMSTDKLLMKWANSPVTETVHIVVKKARKCPNCQVLVERNGGCPHMKCSKCKCSWCYDCGRRRFKIKHIPFMNHDSRFFLLGCSKNLLAQQPHLRRFVRVCVMCGITVLIIPASAIAGVVLVALGILLGLPFGCYMFGVKMRQCSK